MIRVAKSIISTTRIAMSRNSRRLLSFFILTPPVVSDNIAEDRGATLPRFCYFLRSRSISHFITSRISVARAIFSTFASGFLFLTLLKIFRFVIPTHWHKIRALIAGLHDTKLSDVIGYRCYSGKDAELNKMHRAWELPQDNGGDAKGDGDELDDEDISIIMGR